MDCYLIQSAGLCPLMPGVIEGSTINILSVRRQDVLDRWR